MKAKIFDLTEKCTTEKPILKIGDKEYQIDNSVEKALKIGNIDNNLSQNDYVIKFLNETLGEKAVQEMNIMKYSVGTLMEIFYAVTSAITEEDVETIKARFQTK